MYMYIQSYPGFGIISSTYTGGLGMGHEPVKLYSDLPEICTYSSSFSFLISNQLKAGIVEILLTKMEFFIQVFAL